MTADDLAMVLGWRNHIEVRRFMYTQHEISQEEHRRWFMAEANNQNRELLVFEQEGTPGGFVQFTYHPNKVVADWGFYLAPEAARGTGKQLGRAALDHAFGVCGLHKVCGEALAFNEKSIAFHLALGFRQEGVLREQHFDGSRYHDVYCFGLLASEWCGTRE